MRRFAFSAVALMAVTLTGCDRGASVPASTPTPAATAAATIAPVAATASTTAQPSATATGTPGPGPTPKDASYLIGSRYVTLKGGISEVEAAPGSASKVVTRYFGSEATGDLNGDGTADVVFLLTQNSGGSGTFFYVVAAVKTSTGWVGTNGVLLGDRVAPQPTQYRDGTAIVNYADRRAGEAMTERPSIGVSKTFKVLGGQLVVQ